MRYLEQKMRGNEISDGFVYGGIFAARFFASGADENLFSLRSCPRG